EARRGLRIEAMGRPHLRIPELRFIRALSPRPLHNTEKAIRALHRSLVSLTPQHHHFGSIRNGTGCGTASQCDLGLLVRYQVLIQRSHRRIGALGGLCNSLPACVRQSDLQSECQSDDLDLIVLHLALLIRVCVREHYPKIGSQRAELTSSWAPQARTSRPADRDRE